MNFTRKTRIMSLHQQRTTHYASILILTCMISHASAVQPAEPVYANFNAPRLVVSFPNVDQIMWDDITPTHGGQLSEVKLEVQNSALPTPSTRFQGTIELRLFDSPGGGPLGTLIGTVPVDLPVTYSSPRQALLTIGGLENLNINLPSQSFALGISTPTAEWGYIAYDPPSIGISTTARWLTYHGANQGIPFLTAGSYAWQLSVAIPEPPARTIGGIAVSLIFLTHSRRYARR